MGLTGRVCSVCGCDISGRGGRATMCRRCASKVRSEKVRGYVAKHLERVRGDRVVKKRVRAAKPDDRVEPYRCPYCGEVTDSPQGYCDACVDEGFHWLHMTCGRTNGWRARCGSAI